MSGTKQDGKGKSNTVNEQSGIHAGSGGFDIKVGDNTDLKGGLITSKADKDKNTLETGTLTWSDVETGSKWEVKTQGGGLTVGTGEQGAAGSGPLIKPTLKEGDKDTGSAKSGVSPGEITITKPDEQQQNIADLNRDTRNTNDTIKGLPDLQKKLNEQLKTQQEWAQAAENSAKIVKNIADKLHKQDGDIWGEGGAGRAALHAIAGGLLGGVNGLEGAIKAAVGAGVSTIIAPYIKDLVDQAVAQSGLKGEDAKRLSDTLTSSIVLGLLSGAGGSDTGSYAGNEMKYNYLTSSQWLEYVDDMSECTDQKCKEEVLKKYGKISDQQFNDLINCKTEICLQEHRQALEEAAYRYNNDPEFRKYVDHYGGDISLYYGEQYQASYYGNQFLTEQYSAFVPLIQAGLDECKTNPSPDCLQVGRRNYFLKAGLKERGTELALSLLLGASMSGGKGIKGAAIGGVEVRNMNDAVRLSATLAFEEAGLLTRAKNGQMVLTPKAINFSDSIVRGDKLKNPSVIAALTVDGSKIADWAKVKTSPVTLRNGQIVEIHFYKNLKTGKVNYDYDFKIKSGRGLTLLKRPEDHWILGAD